MEIIGDTAGGGEIVVRMGVDNFYEHSSSERRNAVEAQLTARARAEFPWLRSPRVVYYRSLRSIEICATVPAAARKAAIRQMIEAGEQARCACGARGDWDSLVIGTSGAIGDCVWAGCPYCQGRAVGGPIRSRDYDWFIRQKP